MTFAEFDRLQWERANAIEDSVPHEKQMEMPWEESSRIWDAIITLEEEHFESIKGKLTELETTQDRSPAGMRSGASGDDLEV